MNNIKKWCEIQFTIVIVLNILLFLGVIVGETLSGNNYLYKTETFTLSIVLLVISGMIMILSEVYSKSTIIKQTKYLNKEPLIPIDAHSLEVFAIKNCEESHTGKQAFIGFKLSNNDFHFIGVPYTEPASKEKLLYLKEKADNKKALIDAMTEAHSNRKQITKVIKDKPNLTERISAGLDRELQRQKNAGAKFISDEEIDTLIDSVIKEELGDAWKENYE